MKQIHFLRKKKLEEIKWDISETVNARAFKPMTLCSAHLKTYL